MDTHSFIIFPGLWIGEGRVTFSYSPERLRFYTKWDVHAATAGLIKGKQIVEMEGGVEHLLNHFVFSEVEAQSFAVELTSDLLGTIRGKGIIDPKTIAWEFRGNPDFEGFEVYELQENGDYMLHAEYASTDQFRTIIDGRIWRKSQN